MNALSSLVTGLSHVVGHPLVVLEEIRPGGGQGGAEGGGGAAAPDARRRLVQGARQTAGHLEEKKKCVLTVGKHKKRKWRKQYWLAFDDQVQMFLLIAKNFGSSLFLHC